MKQTAVEWLCELQKAQLGMLFESDIEKAKEMEKQQMKEMYLKGIENYDPTFKKKEESKQETLEEVGMYQQELFNYLHDLGVIALQSELQEIERIVLSMQQERMYSVIDEYVNDVMGGCNLRFEEWFKQFKNK